MEMEIISSGPRDSIFQIQNTLKLSHRDFSFLFFFFFFFFFFFVNVIIGHWLVFFIFNARYSSLKRCVPTLNVRNAIEIDLSI